MGKKILIVVAVLLAAAAYLIIDYTGRAYRDMQSTKRALAPSGASIAASADCEHWATGEDSRAAFSVKALLPSPTKFAFLRMSIPGLGDAIVAADSNPRNLLMSHPNGETWVALNEGWIVHLGTEGYVGAGPAPADLNPQKGPGGAISLVIAIGNNPDHEASLTRYGGHLSFVQRNGDHTLVCGGTKGCSFVTPTAKVTDPQEISSLKKDWDRTGLTAVASACRFLNTAQARDALKRYDAVDGACQGKISAKKIQAALQDGTSICSGWQSSVAPLAEAFFAVQ